MIVGSINNFTMVLALKYLKIRPSGTWLEPQEEYGTVSKLSTPKSHSSSSVFILEYYILRNPWQTHYFSVTSVTSLFWWLYKSCSLVFFWLTSCSLSEHTRRCIKIRPRNQPSYWSFPTGQPLRNPHIWLWLKINTPIVYIPWFGNSLSLSPFIMTITWCISIYIYIIILNMFVQSPI